MKLLTPTSPSELPADALLARLSYRRSSIETAAPAADPVCWVYQRLNRGLRKQLEPFLDLLAMRCLVLRLRYGLAGEAPSAQLKDDCLLAKPLQQLAATPGGGQDSLARLEAALAADYPFVSGLVATYRNQGPGGVEQQLAAGILRHSLAGSRHQTLIMLLRYLIDLRNCLTIHKFWRWQIRRMPPLTAGGSLARATLQRVWATHDSTRLTRLAGQLAGSDPPAHQPVAMEQCLLNGLSQRLRQAGREPLELGVIIDYLWRSQLAVHNQVLRQTLAGDGDDLLEEVLLL